MGARWRELVGRGALRAVLVLGLFPDWRQQHLEAIRDELRRRHYAPIVVDLDNPVGPTLNEAMANLVHVARFAIVDLGESREFAPELSLLAPSFAGAPLQVIAPDGYELEEIVGLTGHEPYRYRDTDDLVESFEQRVVRPLEARVPDAK